jgi:hypothetical protein
MIDAANYSNIFTIAGNGSRGYRYRIKGICMDQLDKLLDYDCVEELVLLFVRIIVNTFFLL